MIVFLPDEPGVGNSVAIITDRDVIVVDSTLTPAGAEAIVETIRRRTDLPVRYVVNTHWHDDHIWGNQAFLSAFAGAEIISHTDTRTDVLQRAVPALASQRERIHAALIERRAMLQSGLGADDTPLTDEQRTSIATRVEKFEALYAETSKIRPTPPTLTFDERMVLHRRGEEIHIFHAGRAHSRGDVTVYLPQRKLLITGDLLTLPVPAAAEAFIVDWIAALRRLATLDVVTIVPGHGPLQHDRSYMTRVIELLEAVADEVHEGIRRGLDLEQLLETVKLEELKAGFVGDDPRLAAGFDRFFLRPAVESLWNNSKRGGRLRR